MSFSVLALIGAYNAVMINTESQLSSMDVKKFKRLDEVYGQVKAGRKIATTSEWQKIAVTKKNTNIEKVSTRSEIKEDSAISATASIQEALSLKLVEIHNPKKWQHEVSSSDFTGAVTTHNGIIETLSASLPGNISLDISFAEMNGNTFQYDLNGESFSGLMYQVDQNSYMVTLTNGPMEGTRMRFNSSSDNQIQQELTEQYLAENHNIEIGSFGEEPAHVEHFEGMAEVATGPMFNFNSQI
jgi:hypothetical protein